MHVTRVIASPAGASTSAGTPAPASPAPAKDGGVWLAWLTMVLARRTERRQLLALDERDLRDIGLARAEAWALARRPLWRR
jgi:uncharacterized protein YjiS (DUF1127 family)